MARLPPPPVWSRDERDVYRDEPRFDAEVNGFSEQLPSTAAPRLKLQLAQSGEPVQNRDRGLEEARRQLVVMRRETQEVASPQSSASRGVQQDLRNLREAAGAEAPGARHIQIRRELHELETEVQRDFLSGYGKEVPSFFRRDPMAEVANREPLTVTTRVTERFRMPTQDPADRRRLESIQAELNTVRNDLEKPALASIEAFRTEMDKVKAGFVERPQQMGAIDRIRVELNTVRQDLERPVQRPRSATPQSRFYQPMVPMSPILSINPTSWPPPPLPPVSSELTMRLNSLEAQRSTTEDVAYERLVEELQAKLRDTQAWVAQQSGLQLQIERCNAEWKERVLELEARSRQHEIEMESRLQQVAFDMEERSRDEREQLRLDMEAARIAARRAREEAQRRLQEEIDRLGGSLQASRDLQWKFDEARQSQDDDAEGLEIALEELNAEARRLNSKIGQSEERIRELALALQEVRNSSEQSVDNRSIRLTITTSISDLEELRRQLAEAEAARELLSSDLEHMKKANDQRSTEATGLRISCQQERTTSKALKADLDSFVPPERPSVASQRWDVLRTSVSSQKVSSPRNSKAFVNTVMNEVDLTEDLTNQESDNSGSEVFGVTSSMRLTNSSFH